MTAQPFWCLIEEPFDLLVIGTQKYLIVRNAPCILAQFTIQQFHCFTPDCRTAAVQQLLYDIEKDWGRQEKVNLEKKGSFHDENNR